MRTNEKKRKPYVMMLNDSQINTLFNLLESERQRYVTEKIEPDAHLKLVKAVLKSLENAVYQSLKWQNTNAPDKWKRR
jgi:hypothetical protein